MSLITPNFSQSYLESVPRRRPGIGVRKEEGPPVELKETDAQALVVGSGLVVAAEKVPAQTRADIVNCTLFAQLAATARVSEPEDITRWYQEYFGALTALGWAQSGTQFEKYESSASGFETHKSILKVLTPALGPGSAALVLVTDALTALHDIDQNSPWITLFDTQSTVVNSARFQVATAQRSAEGVPGFSETGLVDVALVAFDLRAKATLTQVLFFKFKKNSTRLKFAQGRATIYESVLAEVRDEVARRLSAYRLAYIGEVALPKPPGTSRASSARRALARVRRGRLTRI